ncbi:MAG: MATE family efflux transporter [candidate division NC10 bacterium]|nr:MATE family efflux transporter [candidate division NC10 bacterium]
MPRGGGGRSGPGLRAEAAVVRPPGEAWADTRAIRKAVLRLALPIVASNLLQRGVGIVDALMVGRLGAAELAAVGLAQLLIFFQMALVYGLGVGLTVMVAYHTGAGDAARRAQMVRSGLAMGLGLAAGLSLLGLWGSRWAAALLGASGRVLELAVAYLLVSWLLFAFLVFLHLLSAIFQGAGDTRTPLKVVTVVNLLHVAVALPLVFGLMGAPALGVVGAAVGSGVSEAVGVAWLLVLARRRGLLLTGAWADREAVLRMGRVGWPAIGERLVTNGMQLAFARVVIGFGVAIYAAHQVGLNIEALSFLPGLAFAQAATALVGQRVGARDPEGARRTAGQAVLVALAVMTAFGASFLLAPALWVRLFTPEAEVLAWGEPLLRIMGLLQVPLALALALAGSLRGAGETRTVLLAAIVGGWVVRIPLAVGLGVWAGYGILLVWLTMILDWVVRALLMGWRLTHLDWGRIRL